MRLGVAGRITVLVLCVILALGALLGMFFAARQSAVLSEALDQRAAMLARTLAENMQYPVMVKDDRAISRLVGGVLNQPDVVSCRVLDGSGVTLYAAGDSLRRDTREFMSAVSVAVPRTGGEELLVGGDAIGTVEVVATVQIRVSLEELKHAIASTQRTVIVFVMVVTLGATLASFLLLRLFLGRPLEMLAAATRRLARGELGVVVPIESRDEIGDLAGAFNAMTAELQNSVVSREYVDKIIDSMIDAVIVLDTSDRITRVNSAACRLIGYDVGELLGKPFSTIFVAQTSPHDATKTDTRRFMTNMELTMRNKDGAAVPVMFSSSAMRDAAGGIQAIVCVAIDIREQRAAEQEIRKLSSAVEQSNEGIALAELDGTLTYVNNAFARMHGYDPGALNGMPLARLHPHGDERYATALAAMSGGAGWAGEMLSSTSDGSSFPTYVSGTVLRDGSGAPIALVVHVTDVSHQKELESKLQQSQKLESIGQLAGGIAHDFNNMLGAISGYAEMIRQRYAAGNPQLDKYAQRILEASKRSADLTAKLLAFARKAAAEMSVVDVHATIGDVIALLEHTIDRRIAIVRRLEAPAATVLGDKTQLQNAILNLAVNARDAMPEGGEMRFSTALVPAVGVPWRGQRPAHGPSSYLRVSVKDSGVGMDDNTLNRIFEPFFTTKQLGKGTGLGLASVYGTVETHKGTVDVRSEVGKGSRFDIYLPFAERPLGADAPAAEARIESGKGVVMVVDDEDLVREMARDMLTHLGYRVVECANGGEAVEYYSAHSSEVDLVILDMIMPRIGGYDCFLALKRINPSVRTLVSSGYAINDDVRRTLDAGAKAFVQKPFDMAGLAKTLRQVLDRT